ncbi:diguanylate cyclase (GGDEF) domain-containing protein [Rhizobiales bacterium GAS191]|nr:diguanylate cyclase (GGDEF) domain-containing protein [Rhizobiales bacterium GAS191]
MLKNATLVQRYWIISIFVMVCTAAIGAKLLLDSYREYKRDAASLGHIEDYREVLRAANLLAAEHGPSDSLLGEEASGDAEDVKRLSDARGRSDAALDRVASLFSGRPQDGDRLIVLSLTDIRQTLMASRATLDALIHLPLARRSEAALRNAIESMFGVVFDLQPVIDQIGTRVVTNDPRLAGVVMMARLLGDLREYGGRIASEFTPSISNRKILSIESRVNISRVHGRIDELRFLIDHQAGLYLDDPRIQEAKLAFFGEFFIEGFAQIERLLEEGRSGSNYSMTTRQLADFIAPKLVPLEMFRETFLDIGVERVREARDAAWDWMLLSCAVMATILTALVIGIWLADRHIFRPLMATRREIIDLAGGDVSTPERRAVGSVELRVLFEALDILRASQNRRDMLEKEREVLSAKLKQQAETDALTGLLNRRALDRIGQGVVENWPAPCFEVGLILFDIDHFKAVNDLHGHVAGDRALQEIATRTRDSLRATDVVARYGGEEFAILLPNRDLNTVGLLAEKVRRSIAGAKIEIAPGKEIDVAASFGVAVGRRGDTGWEPLLKAADAALYEAKRLGRNRVVLAPFQPPAQPAAPEPRTGDPLRQAV